MKITNELIESVCLKLGIECTKAKDIEGGMYIKEGDNYRKLTNQDFKECFRFLKCDNMSNNVYKGADFQCDQTEGYPVSLCYDWDEETAFLELNYSMADDDMDIEYYEGLCKEWGTRPCYSWEDYNDYLSELGKEAYNNAAVLDEEDE